MQPLIPQKDFLFVLLLLSRCASGFYGNPQVVGGSCVSCECNGNVNVSEAGYCDAVTGECLRCLDNTAGKHCEACRPGYYGDAVIAKDCKGECLFPQFCLTGWRGEGLCVTSLTVGGACSCRLWL